MVAQGGEVVAVKAGADVELARDAPISLPRMPLFVRNDAAWRIAVPLQGKIKGCLKTLDAGRVLLPQNDALIFF